MSPKSPSVDRLLLELCRDLALLKHQLAVLATVSRTTIALAQRQALDRQGRVILTRFAEYLEAIRDHGGKASGHVGPSSPNLEWLLRKWEKL